MEEGQDLAEDPAQIASVTLDQTAREKTDFHASVGLNAACFEDIPEGSSIKKEQSDSVLLQDGETKCLNVAIYCLDIKQLNKKYIKNLYYIQYVILRQQKILDFQCFLSAKMIFLLTSFLVFQHNYQIIFKSRCI